MPVRQSSPRAARQSSLHLDNSTAGATSSPGATLIGVPTSRPRHAIAETPDVTVALAAAARRWPEDRDRPARLLRRLIEEGRRSIEPRTATRRTERLDAAERISASYTGLYEPGYLDDLRSEWPA